MKIYFLTPEVQIWHLGRRPIVPLFCSKRRKDS